MKIEFRRLVPPGFEVKQEVKYFCWGLLCAVLFSFYFPFRLNEEIINLYRYTSEGTLVLSGNMMPDFAQILGPTLYGFFLLAAGMLVFVLLHYLYHYHGSKSIYLMRRISKQLELHKRCLILPAAGIAISLVAAFLMLLIYFGVYMLATPEQCLTPHQWQKIWSVLS